MVQPVKLNGSSLKLKWWKNKSKSPSPLYPHVHPFLPPPQTHTSINTCKYRSSISPAFHTHIFMLPKESRTQQKFCYHHNQSIENNASVVLLLEMGEGSLYVALAVLKLSVFTILASNSEGSACPYFSNARTKSMCYYAQLYFFLMQNTVKSSRLPRS